MKLSEIQTGERYLVGYGYGGKVLEVRCPRVTASGTTRKDGVRVRYFAPDRVKGREEVTTATQVRRLWDEYEREIEAQKLARDVQMRDQQRMSERIEVLGAALQEVGIDPASLRVTTMGGYNDPVAYGSGFSLSAEDTEKLIALLNAPQTAVSVPGDAPSALASLIG